MPWQETDIIEQRRQFITTWLTHMSRSQVNRH